MSVYMLPDFTKHAIWQAIHMPTHLVVESLLDVPAGHLTVATEPMAPNHQLEDSYTYPICCHLTRQSIDVQTPIQNSDDIIDPILSTCMCEKCLVNLIPVITVVLCIGCMN